MNCPLLGYPLNPLSKKTQFAGILPLRGGISVFPRQGSSIFSMWEGQILYISSSLTKSIGAKFS